MKPSALLKRTVRYTSVVCIPVITHSLLAVSRFNSFSRYFTEHCAALYANLSLNYSIAMIILIFFVRFRSDNRNAGLTTDQSTIFQRAQGGLSGTEQERSGAGARSTSTRTHREISGTDRPRSGVSDSSTYTGPQYIRPLSPACMNHNRDAKGTAMLRTIQLFIPSSSYQNYYFKS